MQMLKKVSGLLPASAEPRLLPATMGRGRHPSPGATAGLGHPLLLPSLQLELHGLCWSRFPDSGVYTNKQGCNAPH